MDVMLLRQQDQLCKLQKEFFEQSSFQSYRRNYSILWQQLLHLALTNPYLYQVVPGLLLILLLLLMNGENELMHLISRCVYLGRLLRYFWLR